MKKSRLLFALFAIPFLLVGCKGHEDAEGKTVVNFFGWGAAEEQANFQYLINKFMEENPDVKVVYEATDSGSYMNTLENKGKSLPDVFYIPDYEFFAWADGGKLLPLDEYVTQEEIDSVWEQSISMYRYDRSSFTLGTGKLYGLPKDLGPYSLCFNTDMLDAAIAKAAAESVTISYPSFTEPMTFTEFTNYLVTLKPYLAQSTKNPKGYGVSSYELMDAVWSNNADFFTADARTSKITEKNFTDALQWIADLDLVHHVMPNDSEQRAQNGYQRFLNEGCLFTFMGPWDLKAYWENIRFNFDIIPTPVGTAAGSKSTSWVGSVAFVCRNSFGRTAKEKAKKEASVKLAKWLTFSDTANKENYKIGQAMPNNIQMAKTDFLNNVDLADRKLLPAHKQVWLDMVETTDKVTSRRRAKYYLYDGTCYDDLLADLSPVWSGQKTAAEFCASYNARFQKGLTDSAANLE